MAWCVLHPPGLLSMADRNANASAARSPGSRVVLLTDCRRKRAAHATRTVEMSERLDPEAVRERDPDATLRAACSCVKRDRGGRSIRVACVWPGVFAAQLEMVRNQYPRRRSQRA